MRLEELGATPDVQRNRSILLVQKIEELDMLFLRVSCWPDGFPAALGIITDSDSITRQYFLLRIFEVR